MLLSARDRLRSRVQAALAPCSRDWPGDPAPRLAEGEGFEPSGRLATASDFRDRAETAAIPHHNWSLRPRGIQGGNEFRREGLGYPSAAERDSAARMGFRRSAGQWAALLHLVPCSSLICVGRDS